MNLIRRDTFPLFSHRDDFFFPIEQHFNKVLDEFLGSSTGIKASSSGYPKMDVSKEDDKLVVKIAIPGVASEDIQVEVHEGALKISGKMSEEYQSSEGAHYYVRELKKSSFVRHLTLPNWVEGDPEAAMKDGILRLSWPTPKEVEPEKPRLIPIKTE
tara:strand:- start:2510 stop:2980 length:471 start_codon:yes stop_codon:yes gene_type:complete